MNYSLHTFPQELEHFGPLLSRLIKGIVRKSGWEGKSIICVPRNGVLSNAHQVIDNRGLCHEIMKLVFKKHTELDQEEKFKCPT